MAETISSKASLVLQLPPSCMQFCPQHPQLFVIGTYNLDKQEGGRATEELATQSSSRNGSLIVYNTDGSSL